MFLNENGDTFTDFSPQQMSSLQNTGSSPIPIHALIGRLNTNYLMTISEPLIVDDIQIGSAYDIGAVEIVPEPAFFIVVLLSAFMTFMYNRFNKNN